MADQNSIMAWATVAMAAATVLLAAVTAWQEQIQSWLKHPTLVVTCVHDRPDCEQIPLLAPSSFSLLAYSYYARLRVNNMGHRGAESVEVIAYELFKQQAGGEFKRVVEFPQMNLRWTHTGASVRPLISAGTYKHCDLFHVIDPVKRKEFPYEEKGWPETDPTRTIISFDTEVQPNNLTHLVEHGTYLLHLVIASANAKQVRLAARITVTGDWYEDEKRMLADGFHVKLEPWI